MTPRSLFIVVVIALGCCLPAQPLAAQDFTELDGTPIDSRLRRAWSGNWREFARYCAPFESGYIAVPDFDRRTPSSRGLTEREAIEDLTQTYSETTGIIRQSRSWTPPREEAEAYANAIPDMDLGTYGYVHSVEVVEILGPEQMLVKNIWLIDSDALEREYNREMARGRDSDDRNYRAKVQASFAQRLAVNERQDEDAYEQTCRLVGYSTRGLRPGARFTGPDDEGFQIAVASWDLPPVEEEAEGEDPPRRPSRQSRNEPDPMLVLIDPAPVLRRTATEEQFIELLDQRGMKIVEFIELVRELREDDRETTDELVFNELFPDGPDDRE